MRSLLCILLVGCATVSEKPTLEKKLSDNPNDRAVNLRLGEQAEASGDTLRAEQYYLRAEALGVPQEEILPRLLRVLVNAHRYDEALERCKKRLDLKPEDRATRYVEAALYVAVDRPKEAEKELDSLVRTKPDDADAYLALAPNGAAAAQVRYELAEPAPALAEPPHDP